MADEIVWVELRYVVPVRVDYYDDDDGLTREERAERHREDGSFYEYLEAPYWPVEADYEVVTDPRTIEMSDWSLAHERQTHRVDVVFDPKTPDA